MVGALVRTLIVPNLDRAEAWVTEHRGEVAPLLRQRIELLIGVVRGDRILVLLRLLIGELRPQDSAAVARLVVAPILRAHVEILLRGLAA